MAVTEPYLRERGFSRFWVVFDQIRAPEGTNIEGDLGESSGLDGWRTFQG